MKLDEALLRWNTPHDQQAILRCADAQITVADFQHEDNPLVAVSCYCALVRGDVFADLRFEMVAREVGQRIPALWERDDWELVRKAG